MNRLTLLFIIGVLSQVVAQAGMLLPENYSRWKDLDKEQENVAKLIYVDYTKGLLRYEEVKPYIIESVTKRGVLFSYFKDEIPKRDYVEFYTSIETNQTMVKDTHPALWGNYVLNKGDATVKQNWSAAVKNAGIGELIKLGGDKVLLERLGSIEPYLDAETFVKVLKQKGYNELLEAYIKWEDAKLNLSLLENNNDSLRAFMLYWGELKLAKELIEQELNAVPQKDLLRVAWNYLQGLHWGTTDYSKFARLVSGMEAGVLSEQDFRDYINYTQQTWARWIVNTVNEEQWVKVADRFLENSALLGIVDKKGLEVIFDSLIQTRQYDKLRTISTVLLNEVKDQATYELLLLKLAKSMLLNKSYLEAYEYIKTLDEMSLVYVSNEEVRVNLVQILYLRGDFAKAYEVGMLIYENNPRGIDPEIMSRLAGFTGNSYESRFFEEMK